MVNILKRKLSPFFHRLEDLGQNKKFRSGMDAYIRHKNYFNSAIGETYQLRQVIQFIGVISAAIKFVADIPTPVVVKWASILFLPGLLAFWSFGLFMDKVQYFHRKNEFNNKRNHFVDEMRAMEKRLMRRMDGKKL